MASTAAPAQVPSPAPRAGAPVVIVDIGTSFSKIGSSGDAKPAFWEPRQQDAVAVWDSVLHNAQNYDTILSKSGLVVDGESDVMIVESVSEKDTYNCRAKLCEILFEKRKLNSVSFQYAPVLTCFSNARQTGLVIDMSGGGCTASAVLDGWSLHQTNMERSELGGEDLDAWLSGIDNGPNISGGSFEKLKTQRLNRESSTYTLPDGTIVSEKVRQTLFDPSPLDNPAKYVPLHELVFTAAMKQTSNEVRKSLMNNIVVSGGLSCTEGVNQQLANELIKLARMDHPRIISCGPQERSITSWIGGSILSSLSIYRELCVTGKEFEEAGMTAVTNKCA